MRSGGRGGTKEIVTDTVHVAIGFVAGFFTLIQPFVTTIIYAQFMIYEVLEWFVVHDRVYNDLKEFGIGFAFGLIASILASILAPQTFFFFRTL